MGKKDASIETCVDLKDSWVEKRMRVFEGQSDAWSNKKALRVEKEYVGSHVAWIEMKGHMS